MKKAVTGFTALLLSHYALGAQINQDNFNPSVYNVSSRVSRHDLNQRRRQNLLSSQKREENNTLEKDHSYYLGVHADLASQSIDFLAFNTPPWQHAATPFEFNQYGLQLGFRTGSFRTELSLSTNQFKSWGGGTGNMKQELIFVKFSYSLLLLNQPHSYRWSIYPVLGIGLIHIPPFFGYLGSGTSIPLGTSTAEDNLGLQYGIGTSFIFKETFQISLEYSIIHDTNLSNDKEWWDLSFLESKNNNLQAISIRLNYNF